MMQPQNPAALQHEHKKTFTPGKTENEGIQNEPHSTQAEQAGLILLLTEKLALRQRADACLRSNLDEHSRADILTSGLNLAPAFPVWWTSGCGSL